ncbi:MAG TPA: carboxypeptidase-like regulatory domain-containing protein [Thermoanaerobaculia bacterium]|nr:carboxypeptidase-like regulatory domain-containing protein [Thermoanaerobaculia bacterium]
MRRSLTAFLASALSLAAATGVAFASPPPSPPIAGVVRHLEQPISGALVIFYNLGDTTLTRSRSAVDGTFVLASAPVGVYDLIAYKRGFLPSLVRLWHQALPERVSSVEIKLAAAGHEPNAPSIPSTLWELRDRLPADVLREIALEEVSEAPAASLDRLRLDRLIAGELRTVTDVGGGESSLSRAAVGVRGGLPNGWKYDLHGDYAAVSDSQDLADESASGNAAGLALDVATSPVDQVRLSSRRHSIHFGEDSPASLQSHGVSWSRGAREGSVESVGARYIEEANLYRATALGTSFFPVASRTWEVNARYARPAEDTPGVSVAMTYRHREATVGPSGVGSEGAFFLTAPDADLSASTSLRLFPNTEVEGGVVARYLAGGYGIAPRATVRYDLGNGAVLFVRGLYRVAEPGIGNGTVLPRVSSIEENAEPASREGYAVGIERRAGDSSFKFEASTQRMDEVVRAFFEGDLLTDFDSVYFFDGNSVRQVQASARHRLSDTLAGSVAVRYGDVRGSIASDSATSFGITGSDGHYWSARAAVEIVPTKTGVAILVRGVRQSLESAVASHTNDSDKLAISIAQDLSIVGLTPFGSDWKLLLALESARSTAASEREESASTSRILGGLALAF